MLRERNEEGHMAAKKQTADKGKGTTQKPKPKKKTSRGK
jgi:hypothetical protein